MNATEFANLMLQWEEAKRAADEMEARICEHVMGLGKTQTVGNVRATYSSGRKTYNYEDAAMDAPPETIEAHTRAVVDWRAVCQAAGIEPPVLKQGEPTVRVKLM